MKNTTLIKTTLVAGIVAFAMIAAKADAPTFETIRFDAPIFSAEDPLGVTAITRAQGDITTIQTEVATVSNEVETAKSAAATAQETATQAQTKATTLETTVAEVKEAVTNTISTTTVDGKKKSQLTGDVVVIGNVKDGNTDVVMQSGTNSIVFAVNRDIEDVPPEDGSIKFDADAIKFPGVNGIWFGDSTLATILSEAGQGEINTIVTVKTNGVALIPDSNRAIDITIPEQKEISLDGKLDATNGVAFGDLKVYPMPSDTIGQPHVIITHESISIGVGGGVEYKENEISYNGETYEFSSDTNGIARLKDIPTISTNGVAIAPDSSKNINIDIPAPGEGNVIETIKTNGVAVAISNKEVDIAIPTVPDISGLATKQEVSELTITTAKVTDLDSYKNPTISAAALVAIDGINNAQDIATIKSTLTNFLQQFVITPAP